METETPNSLENRIHTLITKAIATSDPAELEKLTTELKAALREHIRKLRVMAFDKLSAARPQELPKESPHR